MSCRLTPGLGFKTEVAAGGPNSRPSVGYCCTDNTTRPPSSPRPGRSAGPRKIKSLPCIETAAQEHPQLAPQLTATLRARESRPKRPADPAVQVATHTSISKPRAPNPRHNAPCGPIAPRQSKQTGPRPSDTGLGSSPNWTRTSDLAVNSRSLYQLSYRGSNFKEPNKQSIDQSANQRPNQRTQPTNQSPISQKTNPPRTKPPHTHHLSAQTNPG